MLVSLQIQGGPHELASVLAAIGGISLPVEAPAAPVALPAATETKQPRKAAAKQSVPAPAPEILEEAPSDEQVKALQSSASKVSQAAEQTQTEQPAEESKVERLSLEKIRAVFNDKLAGHRDTIKGILTSYDSKGLTEFYGKASPEQHAEFFNKISAL